MPRDQTIKKPSRHDKFGNKLLNARVFPIRSTSEAKFKIIKDFVVAYFSKKKVNEEMLTDLNIKR